MVTGLGFVSLFADMVADGGKSVYGPLLGSGGASALVVGLIVFVEVTQVAALALLLVSDRSLRGAKS